MTMHHQHRTGRHGTGAHRRSALWLGLAAIALGAAGPAPEYGPEVEARFIERCIQAAAQPSAARCQRAMERLQAENGYEAFLELAANTAAAPPEAAEQRLALAIP